jgi:predicted permease
MKLFRKLCALVQKSRLDAEMSEEMRLHLELQTEQNVARGMDPNEARYAARRMFGGLEQIKEHCRDRRSFRWFDDLGRDFRFCFRSLGRSSAFSITVIVTLALCIGANTTIMSVLYGMVLRPLPFHDAGQVVEIYNSMPKGGQFKRPTSVAQFLDYKANADLFEGFALWRLWTFNLDEESDPERGIGARVTADIFTILGVQPLIGRFYTMEECVPGKDKVVVLTQSLWEKRFQSDTAVIGKVIRLSGQPFTVIGVAPRKLESLNVEATLFKPFEFSAQLTNPQTRSSLSSLMYARVKPGVSFETARAQLATLEKRYYDHVAAPVMRDFLDRGGYRVALSQVRAEQTQSVRAGLLLLQGGALLVLLLGCVNVANLMLARASARQGEFAIRQALGAGGIALARQLLTEGLVLAMAGAGLGLALAWAGLRIINTYTATIVREVAAVALDGPLLGLTLLVSLGVALFISLLPMLRIGRADLIETIQGGMRSTSAGGGLRTVSGLLVTAQVALAAILLVGAGLLFRSFDHVMAVDLGFDSKRVHHGRTALGAGYTGAAAAKGVQDRIIAAMQEIPGVEAVSVSTNIPVNSQTPVVPLAIRGSVLDAEDTYPTAAMLVVSPGFFATMGLRILEGRDFTEADTRVSRPLFIVDQNLAMKYFPGRSAVGEGFLGGAGNETDDWPLIIGVVQAAKLNGPEDPGQVPFAFGLMRGAAGFSIQLRSSRSMADLLPLMRQKLREVDPSLPLYATGTLDLHIEEMLANRRGVMWLLGAFAGIALFLSAIGIYGMLAYDITQRTKEIGIRGAIGATREQILSIILRQGMSKACVGLAIGLAVAAYLSRYIASLLFQVKPTDPVVFYGAFSLLFFIALLASWLPARRATKVDPMVALRCE